MATRKNTLLLKRSNVLNKVPTLSDLRLGELAINVADAKLYTPYTSGATGATEVREIGWNRVARTGDTMTGTLFTPYLSATTVSATTYLNLPIDIRVTGGTYNNGTGIATFTNNTGGTFNVTGFYTNANDVYVTGGTPNNAAKTYTFTNNTGGTFTVTSLTDITITGTTFANNILTLTNNTGGTFTTLINNFSGLTINGNLNVTGTTTTSILSATTYLNLPTDIRVTGGTVSRSSNLTTLTFTNNTGGTFNVSSIFDTFVTGGTYSTGGTLTFTNNSGNTFNVTGLTSSDTFSTAFTYSNNVFTIARNQGLSSLTALINTMTGLTVNGNVTITGDTTSKSLSATTISSTTLTVSGVTFNKLLIEKVGLAAGTGFTGNPKKFTVTFGTNFSDTNYGIFFTGPADRVFIYESQTVSGFTINATANGAFTGNVYWMAKQLGEV